MKTPQLSIIVMSVISGIVLIASTNLAFAEQPPIIITQVELWGPTSFYADGVKICESNETTFGPWAPAWIELYNTKNETITMDHFDLIITKGGTEASVTNNTASA
ncbi:MAG: hypothetical protein HY222_04945 [Thaumarchaeota archaeon]|nr:hypothetical protein [Nitrososphaerota archaeon]MBI3641722.1 hypothetical protein [Nitrososphaerota archaeon]